MKKKRKKPMRCPYCGAPVVYRSADGQEVNVYNAQISGKSANTDKGSLHWY